MNSNRSLLVVASALLLVFAGACSKSNSAKTPTKAEYIAAGNAICKKGNARLDALSKKMASSTTAEREKAIKDTVAPDIRGQIKDIRALGYPKGDQAKLAKQLDAMDKVLDTWEKDPSKASNSTDVAAINKALSAYGLTECGSA